MFDRVRGSLLGGAIGDALGWPIEFLGLDQIRERYGAEGVTGFLPQRDETAPQRITDDTQMTLFTAEGLLRSMPGSDPLWSVRRAYLRWLSTQRTEPPVPEPDGWLASQRFLYAARAPGTTCMSGLGQQAREYVGPNPFGEPGRVNPHSKGCGTVMRSAPFGLAGLGAERAFGTAAQCAQLTHGHPTGYLAAGAFAALVDRVISGVEGDVRAALLLSVNHSGDSDSTGAVAGNLLGAIHGLDALPMDWAAAVEGRDVLVQVADDLVVNFGYGTRAPLAARYPLDDGGL